jgi:hypothetical protein
MAFRRCLDLPIVTVVVCRIMAGFCRHTYDVNGKTSRDDKNPMGVTVFPAGFSKPPRSWVERVYNVQYWNEVDTGGHFAAMEQP